MLRHGLIPDIAALAAFADRQHYRFQHGQAGKQGIDLEGTGHAALDAFVLRQAGDVLLPEKHFAGGRRQAAGQQIDERRFTGAVGADQRMARARRKCQADVAVGFEGAPLLG